MAKISDSIGGLFAAFGATGDAARLDVYYAALKDVDPVRVSSACKSLLTKKRFLPSLAEIIDEIKKQTGQALPDPADIAEREAANVLRLIKTVGYYETPQFADPITRRLLQSRFDWRGLCETLREDTTQWFVKDFVRAYLAEFRISETMQLTNDEARQLLNARNLDPLKRVEQRGQHGRNFRGARNTGHCPVNRRAITRTQGKN